jgi:formate hydrogenlyase subunit 3/multisubunit Na+/H+ antiporter MnhD subunit
MSAPVIYIIIPGILGIALFTIRKLERVVVILGVLVSLWLAAIAWLLPIGEVVTIGQFTIKLTDTYSVLGREFILTDFDRPLLSLIFLFHALWVLGALFARPAEAFVPFAFGMTALLTGALAVEPFLYAALLIEITVLLAIPLLSPPGAMPGRGVFRFLAFQTFGMAFILFTGWMLAGLEASPEDLELVVRAGVLLGIGFAFLLAVFPFHSWIPMLAEDSHPYIAAFIFYMLPWVVSLFGLGFLDRFVWLRESDSAHELIRGIGMTMAVVGGIWAAFEVNLGRMLGHIAIVEMGFTLLAVGLGTRAGLQIFFWLAIPRTLAFILWAIALSRIKTRTHGNLHLSAVQGLGKTRPVVALTLLLSHFSLTGLPFLSSFPVRMALWEQVAIAYPVVAGGAILGSIGVLVGGLRTMSILFAPSGQDLPSTRDALDQPPDSLRGEQERILSWTFLAITTGITILMGLFPDRLFPVLEHLVSMFEQLGS